MFFHFEKKHNLGGKKIGNGLSVCACVNSLFDFTKKISSYVCRISDRIEPTFIVSSATYINANIS